MSATSPAGSARRAAPASGPLTLGTAGHVDHGKTALVGALTGVQTDRLREERERGLTIVLGYAPLALPSGRRLSLIDVPGHERFVRTMVAGASGVDAFLMVIAADDGVMPQTLEHAAVLAALGVERGVVAVSKADVADPGPACEQAAALLPGLEIVPCSARTGAGIPELAAALDRLVADLDSRAGESNAPARLHVDRCFTIAGRGTVLTGTLWSGVLGVGQTLELAATASDERRRVRVRGLEVHDEAVESAAAGQRVAVNLNGVQAAQASRGDVLLSPGLGAQTRILDCELELDGATHSQRVQVHHGTRDVPGRLCALSGELWQLRLERPLLALAGDRLVVRRLAPPDTLGGGRVLDPHAARHGAREQILARLRRLSAGEDPDIDGEPAPAPPEPAASAQPEPAPRSPAEREADEQLTHLLLDAGWRLLSEAQLEGHDEALRRLRADGTAVRVSGRLYAHATVVADVRERIVTLLLAQQSVTLAGVRDALGLSRKSAQAFLEHLDAQRVTRLQPDERRVLARGAATGSPR